MGLKLKDCTPSGSSSPVTEQSLSSLRLVLEHLARAREGLQVLQALQLEASMESSGRETSSFQSQQAALEREAPQSHLRAIQKRLDVCKWATGSEGSRSGHRTSTAAYP